MDYTSDTIGTFSSGPQFLTIAVAICLVYNGINISSNIWITPAYIAVYFSFKYFGGN